MEEDLLPGRGTYTAVYSREPDGAWIAYIRGHRHEIHSDVSRKLAARRRRTVQALQKSGMGTRDIADLLDLSQQRVSQIARGTR